MKLGLLYNGDMENVKHIGSFLLKQFILHSVLSKQLSVLFIQSLLKVLDQQVTSF